jgi:threonine aldolase
MSMIDLRSDTVTKPTQMMRKAMYEAEVGDDVYGDDPTVNRLQELAAELLGTQAALFVASGTQSNLLALMSHCERGDEYIVGQDAHTYKYEGGGAAVLGSIQPQPLGFEEDGTLDLDRVRGAIKPADSHFANTRLFCLENTHSGKVLPMEYLPRAEKVARDNGLGFHLDGARVFNASVKLGVDVRAISKYFDTTSVCLSKGLGAPVGSVLCGKRELIDRARRWRKVVGGGMRQAGILAAAGILALTEQVERLAEDHENALTLAKGLATIEELEVDTSLVQTNMAFAGLKGQDPALLAEHLRTKGILINPGQTVRFVTHYDVKAEDVGVVVEAIKGYFSSLG